MGSRPCALASARGSPPSSSGSRKWGAPKWPPQTASLLGAPRRSGGAPRYPRHQDTNDAERLAEDPTFRMLTSREQRETSVALTSTLHWFKVSGPEGFSRTRHLEPVQ